MKPTMPYAVLENDVYPDQRIHLRSFDARNASIEINGSEYILVENNGRALRDWLTEWLGEGEPVTYTPTDVEWLVKEVQESIANGNLRPSVHALYKAALAPFLPPPDPDAELVEKMAESANNVLVRDHTISCDWEQKDPRARQAIRDQMRAALAVVRAHDKEHAP